MNRRVLMAILLMLAVLPFQSTVNSCGSARKRPPVGDVSADLASPKVASGEVQFMRYCNKCHPGGETGLGPALNNKSLPGFMISLQVRRGLGAMPSFSHNRLPDSSLSAIIDYMKVLRSAQVRRGATKSGKE